MFIPHSQLDNIKRAALDLKMSTEWNRRIDACPALCAHTKSLAIKIDNLLGVLDEKIDEVKWNLEADDEHALDIDRALVLLAHSAVVIEATQNLTVELCDNLREISFCFEHLHDDKLA